jgi:uncharacterized protein YjbI with pentapeptide repeats
MAKSKASPTPAVPLKLQGKKVYFGGNLYHTVEDLLELVTVEGGTVSDELDDKIDIVVLGFSGAANPQKKAAKLNAQGAAIQVLNFDQFRQMLKPTPDEAVLLLLSGAKGIERWNHHTVPSVLHSFQLHHAAQQKAHIRAADFSKANLTGANLSELVDHSDFTDANLTRCQLNLAHCQLKGARLEGVVSLQLVDCQAEDVDFSAIAAPHLHIESSNLRGSSFAKLGLHAMQVANCQFDGADFSGVKSPGAAFRDCSMTKAKFAQANLTEAGFLNCDLSGADFSSANLKLANFTGARVDGADFTGATMAGAEIAGVDFSKARGFDLAQVQVKGGPGPAVNEFIKVARQAQRVSTSISVTQGSDDIVLTVDHYPSWSICRDTTGGGYSLYQQQQTSPTNLWTMLARKWSDAAVNLGSVTLQANKAPMANKELKQLALRAWCELFGLDVPSEEDLKSAAKSSKVDKKEKTEEWLALLRTDKKGVEKWNSQAGSLAKIVHKVAGVDLSKARLAGIVLPSMEWKGVNLSGADLANAKCIRCRFPEGNLSNASFQGAECMGMTLTEANLENADFSAANLSAASLKRANCKGVNFARAQLMRADFCGADLTGADLSDAALVQATYDENTRWPKKFTPTMEMVWKGPGTSPAAHKLVQSTKPRGKLDIDKFMTRLEALTDTAKLSKALSMLKADRFRLYAQVNADHFVGVVKSQSDADLVYSCRLNADGTYACCTQNLNVCGGLRGSLCKHLLVLIVGLAKNGELDPNVIDTWIRLSKTNKPQLDKDAMSETFLRYKGAEAGEVDWRPTETIPEDYYAM